MVMYPSWRRNGLTESRWERRLCHGHACGRLVFGLFAALAEFEAALIRERTTAGMTAARARGRVGGGPRKMTATTLEMAMTPMADRGSSSKEIACWLGITTESREHAHVRG